MKNEVKTGMKSKYDNTKNKKCEKEKIWKEEQIKNMNERKEIRRKEQEKR